MISTKITVLIGAACGFTMGAATAYLVADKKLKDHYRAISEQEAASLKDAYDRRAKTGAYATPEGAAEVILSVNPDADTDESVTAPEQALNEKYRSQLEQFSYNKVGVDPEARDEAAHAVTVNDKRSIFSGGVSYPEGFDPEEEKDADEDESDDLRDPTKPYIIRSTEYHDDEKTHENTGLTYYEGDHTLTDDSEVPIPGGELDEIVGAKNLTRFGHLSEDDNIVYIRNERLERDYEIIRDHREFSEVVYGLNHSVFEDGPRVRKMRQDD